MTLRKWLSICALASLVLIAPACARSHIDTSGYAKHDALSVPAPFQESWQAAKTVLREKGLDIYTRDTAGTFIAYTEEKRRKFTPHRTQYTLHLHENTDNATEITIQTLDQVFGVTFLTYPGWHDRKTTNNDLALEILEAIYDKVATRG